VRAGTDAQREPARQRHRLGRDTEMGAAHAAVREELAECEKRRVARYGEAQSLRAADHRRVDADDLAGRRNERAARAAGIERRVGLDHVVDQAAVARTEGAAERRHDASGHGRFETQWIADRDDEMSAPQRLRVAERGGPGVRRQGAAQQREIGVGVVADHVGVGLAALGHHEAHVPRASDDVAVRQHEAVAGDDHARAHCAASLADAVDADDRGTDVVGDSGDDSRVRVEWRLTLDVDERERAHRLGREGPSRATDPPPGGAASEASVGGAFVIAR